MTSDHAEDDVDSEMSSLKKLLHGASVGFVLSFVAYVVMFFVKLFAARLLGSEQFGLFTFAQTFLSLGGMIVGLGIYGGVSRYIPYYKERGEHSLLRGYLRFVFTWPLVFSLVIGAIYVVFADSITAFFDYPSSFKTALMIIGFAMPFRALSKTFINILAAEKQILLEQTLKNLANLVLLAGIGVIAFYDVSVLGLVVALGLSLVIISVLGAVFYFLYVNYGLSGRSRGEHEEWLRFSLPLFFSGMLSFVVSWSDNIVIGKFLDPQSLGIYSIAFSMAAFINFFQSSFGTIFTPIISESHANEDHDKISFLFTKSAGWIFGFTLPFFLIMALYSEEILRLFYGAEYTAGFIPLIIIATGFVINVSLGLNRQILTVHKETNFLFWNDVFIAGLNLGLNVWFISMWGIIGAAVATSLSMVLDNLIVHVKARRYETLGFDYWYMTKFVLAGLPAALIGKAVFRLPLNDFVALGVSGGVYAVAYAVMLIALRTFDDEDVRILRTVEERLGVESRWLERFFEYIT